MDNGPDNDSITTLADNMFNDATVTINWPPTGPLPVTLVNFNGNRNGNNVTLTWTTNMEMNNTGFEIQRSAGNGAYEKVGFVPTKSLDGNSDRPLNTNSSKRIWQRQTSWYRLSADRQRRRPQNNTGKRHTRTGRNFETRRYILTPVQVGI